MLLRAWIGTVLSKAIFNGKKHISGWPDWRIVVFNLSFLHTFSTVCTIPCYIKTPRNIILGQGNCCINQPFFVLTLVNVVQQILRLDHTNNPFLLYIAVRTRSKYPKKAVHSFGNAIHRLAPCAGPNCSGKSVYARQVALTVFLAHIGSYVPAISATVGMTDRIFARLGNDGDGGVGDGSSFANDLYHFAAMLKHSGPRSLLIIDEFGKVLLLFISRLFEQVITAFQSNHRNHICYCSYPGSVYNLTPNRLGVWLYTEPGYEQQQVWHHNVISGPCTGKLQYNEMLTNA